MRLILIFLFIVLGNCSSLYSQEFKESEIRAHTRVLDIHASSILTETRATLRGLSNIITRTVLDGKEGHKLFNDTVKDLTGARAILFIDANGALEIDSFSYPFFPRILSDREYFSAAIKLEDGEVFIGEQKKGRSSGIPFVPVSMPVRKDGKLRGVLTAIITPPLLLAYQDPFACLYCLSIILDLEGNTITKYPENFELPSEVTDQMKFDNKPAQGIETVKIGELNARIFWIRNKEFPIISVFLEFIGR